MKGALPIPEGRETSLSEITNSGLRRLYKQTLLLVTPSPRPGAAKRSHPAPEARGGPTPEEHWLRGRAQEGLEELSHVEGQKGVR